MNFEEHGVFPMCRHNFRRFFVSDENQYWIFIERHITIFEGAIRNCVNHEHAMAWTELDVHQTRVFRSIKLSEYK